MNELAIAVCLNQRLAIGNGIFINQFERCRKRLLICCDALKRRQFDMVADAIKRMA